MSRRQFSVLTVRLSQTGTCDEPSLLASNRLPLKNKWTFDTRMRVDFRQNELGEGTDKVPAIIKMGFLPKSDDVLRS